MTLTKEKIAQALKTYKLYWDSYIQGDLETFATTLDEDYEMIGTSESEVAHNKAEGIDFFKAQIQEVGGKTDMRSQQITAKPMGNMVLVNETCDVYVLNDQDLPADRKEWTFYSKIRISTFLHETKSGWKIIQQHGSLPDMPVKEGETIAIEKITKENLELRDAVKRRTIDLENKSRELEIEAALERVRSRSLAMQTPNELGEVVTVIVEKLTDLGVVLDANGVVICTYFQDNKNVLHWIASPDFSFTGSYLLPYFEHPIFNDAWQSRLNGDAYFSKAYSKKEKNSFWEYAFEHSDYKNFPQEFKEWVFQNDQHILSFAWQKNSAILIPSHTGVVPTETDIVILKRFATVFEQAYTRFLDLQKAEAQAKEAQIEVALERVRSRSMAMHKSGELQEVIQVLYNQFIHLNINIEHAGFILDYKENDDMHICLADHNAVFPEITLPYFDCAHWNSFVEAKKTGNNFFTNKLSFDEKNKFYKDLFQFIPDLPEEVQEHYFTCPALAISTVLLDNVGLYIENYQGIPFSDEENDILMRFGKVFQQTYTRFLDLQKSENQAKNAKVEAALERVRAQAMAMHQTEDLGKTIIVYYEQLDDLIDSTIVRCGAGLLNKENTYAEMSTAGESIDGVTYQVKGTIDMKGHPLLENTYEHWLKQKEYSHVLRGNEINAYYQYITNQVAIPKNKGNDALYFYFPMFTEGSFYVVTSKALPENELQIFRRFSSVLSLTYRRFNDLQKAEAQARESQIEAALEKVRSRTLAMQHSEELAETAAVLFSQLISLGVEHERINIGIVSEKQKSIEFWTTEQGGDTVKTSFQGNISEPTVLSKLYQAWKAGEESLLIHLQGAALEHWISYCKNEIGIPFDNRLLGEHRYQSAAFFSKGMLMLTTPAPPPDHTMELLLRFASVFNLTFTRFNDLKVAEAQALQAEKDLIDIKQARQKAEDALIVLKATQTQLIQQEKLASLGQLTAGIAHEIKNPLNFVNNFSEVSREMMQEVREELDTVRAYRDRPIPDGALDDLSAILDDIESNLEKIHHHGTRADSIVKSMLQHSRGGSGKMEPTDLNALIKEYTNLSFHGMRAKKNPINVEIDLQLDPNIKTVSLIGEDFSRVILNLTNNAFDAMRETSEIRSAKLTVRTKQEANAIRIEVEDNGPGIPDAIKDKILQPFFTTKKGTEGTGLGLSITHDIIKAHGGELDIETKEGEGSVFVIRLAS